MSDTVKIKVSMSVGYAIGTDYDEVIDTEISRAEWDAMTSEEREKFCEETYEEWVWQQIDGGWDVVEQSSPSQGGAA